MSNKKQKTAAVMLDDWKLPIFKKALDKSGHEYKQKDGPSINLITLLVKTDDVDKLALIVRKANQDAAKQKPLMPGGYYER